MRSPRGRITADGFVLVEDQAEANRLYNKGFAGNPQRGGALRLSLVEAARLVEEDRLVVEDEEGSSLEFRELLDQAVAAQPGVEIAFFAYRDLRARGYVVRHANKRSLDFLVWRRGQSPPGDPPVHLGGAISERAPLRMMDLSAWSKEAEDEGTGLVLLVVDEEGDLTHYQIEEVEPSGNAPGFTEQPKVEGVFLRDRVMVWDERVAAELREGRYLGQIMPGGLQLSLVEAMALKRSGVLACPGLTEKAGQVEADLELRTRCYLDLAKRGLWVKTGFKFGTHFRVYDEHPSDSHAPWLVDAVTPSWSSSWPVLSRAVRLAHGVRKRYLLAVVDGDEVRYVKVERIRP
jgi:tRNA-intron endonuclease, archaea type